METTEMEELVRSHYQAIGRRDLEAALAPLSPSIEWVFDGPAVIPFAGRYSGIEDVRSFFEAIRSNVRVEEFSIRSLTGAGSQVTVLGFETMTVLKTGRSWSADWVQIHYMEDGKIIRFQEFTDTHAIAAAFCDSV
ncbi:MAG: nuclear transport factor 2 family protein [Proteobacteria bacterium]|nr:nuclear transport factor 2 family protein [Pseudomonadota bacterium]